MSAEAKGQQAELVIIRGLPGSGKSTMASQRFPGHLHYEPDHLFCDTQGRYRFDLQIFDDAQEWVYMMADFALARGESVVVSDVFARLVELRAYVDLARYHEAVVRVIDCTGAFKNVHRVPLSILQRMQAQFEPLPVSGRELSFFPARDGAGIDEYLKRGSA